MESFLTKRIKLVKDTQDTQQELEKVKALAQDLKAQIRAKIVTFYEANGEKIQSVISLLQEAKTCIQLERLSLIKAACLVFRNFVYDQLGREFLIFKWGPLKYFPTTNQAAAQYWVQEWSIPFYKPEWNTGTKLYKECEKKRTLVFPFFEDLSVCTFHLDFVQLICDQTGWKEYYGLTDLDSIGSHIE